VTYEGMVGFLLDQLDDPAVTPRAMFGGRGIYRDGSMFAILYRVEVYMKTPQDEAFSSREPLRPNARQTLRSYRPVCPDELVARACHAQNAAEARHKPLSSKS